jgi:copper chaperone CopZ
MSRISNAITTTLSILGMRGNDCRERVADALGAVKGVHEVEVSYFRARAQVVHDRECAPVDLVSAVESAGYGAAVG